MKKASKILLYLLIPGAVLIFSTVKISLSSMDGKSAVKLQIFKPVIEKMLLKGADSNFINSIISDRRTDFNETYTRVTLPGFTKKPDYSHNYTQYSVEKARSFIKSNYDLLRECEQEYGVPKETITAILWVETKFGEFLGTHHVLSVLLSAALAVQPQYIEASRKNLYKYFSGDSTELQNLEDKIASKAARKSDWAVAELLNLQDLFKKDSEKVLSLLGSWAGAFGLSQFLPSSYNNYAVDGDKDSIKDLFSLPDAIFSIGNYLKKNGWKNNPESQRKAIFSYNNSSDYVDAVIILSEKMKEYSWQLPLRK